ncbi:MAG: acyltransferase family protein [Reyranellaceae bacterium]
MDRVVALDIVKAIAICLLVLGHVIEGLGHRGLIDSTSFLPAFQDWLRGFRMPSFFFAAGAVIGLRPLPPAGYFLRHRLATLAWPHLLWGTIALAVAIVFARYYNSPIQDPGNLGRHLVDMATGQRSWFLAALFVVSLGGYALFRIDARLALAVGLLLCLLPIDSPWRVVSRSADYAVFFALGYGGIELLLRITAAVPFRLLWLLAPAVFALSVVLHLILPPFSHPYWGGVSLLAQGLAGAAGVWCLSTLIAAGSGLRRVLATLGTASLAIFVMHPMAIGAAREILLPLLRHAPPIVPTLAIAVAGIALPAFAYYLLKRTGLVAPVLILPPPRMKPRPALQER